MRFIGRKKRAMISWMQNITVIAALWLSIRRRGWKTTLIKRILEGENCIPIFLPQRNWKARA